MTTLLQVPNKDTVPGEAISSYNAKPGHFYITAKSRCIVHCVGDVFYRLDASRYYHISGEPMFPITLDGLTAHFSYEKKKQKWDEDKNYIIGPDNERIDMNEQPKTTFHINDTFFVRYNVRWDEATQIAAKFGITQICWEGKNMFLVDGKWICG